MNTKPRYTRWRQKYPQEDAEDYFKRIARRRSDHAQELRLQLTLMEDHVLKSITRMSAAELADRNLEAGLDNFYDNYKRGPYTVQLRDVATVNAASPLLSYSYAVLDNELRGVLAGSQHECQQLAEEMNVEYAKHIMVKP